jgi:transcription antitermination factor NusG
MEEYQGCLSEEKHPCLAVRVKSRHEKVVAEALRSKGFWEYLPLTRRIHWSSGHKRVAYVPVLPNYVFSRFDIDHRLPVLTVPGVVSIVGNRNGPLPVDEREFDCFRRLCASYSEVQEQNFGEPGMPVEVVHGPLAGLTGILLGPRSRCRLVVSISLLQRAISVEMDAACVRRLPPHCMAVIAAAAAPAVCASLPRRAAS